MKLGVSLRTSQNLALTPQLQQSIRLLQLSTLEMSQEVEHMLEENPFLETADDDSSDAPSHASETPIPERSERSSDTEASHDTPQEESHIETDVPNDWEGDNVPGNSAEEHDWSGNDAGPRGSLADSDDDVDPASLKGAHVSLAEYLHQQASEFFLDRATRCALDYLIESLNEDGYLEDDLQDLALPLARNIDEVDELLHHFQTALNLLKTFDPAGVGAQSLAECLQLQLRAMEREEYPHAAPRTLQVATQICQHPLELVARRDVRSLSQLTKASAEEIRTALLLIAQLEPKPGRQFADVERNIIIPDVIVRPKGRSGKEFSVQLNPDVMPRLRIHEMYANALRNNSGAGGELQQRLQEARWFIKNIQQRFDTILRVSQAIVERQKNYFIHGEMAMRPLVLREIADELGLHESTISRVTTAKYMDTPHGTVELKYFFGSGLETETGGSTSSTAVRALIKQLIAAEDSRKPLSDSKLSDLLKEQGIECARRTVAKYREALRIAPASLRKSL